MHAEFFQCVHRFHTHRNSAPIREVTRIQMTQIQRTCPSWMLRAVNKFMELNFPPPDSKTG